MEIVIASETDLTAIRKIAFLTWPVAYNNILSDAQLQYMLHLLYDLDSLSRQLNEKKHVFLLAQEDTNVLGFVSYSLEKEIATLHKLYVLPTAQGKNIGRELLSSVEKKAMEVNAFSIQLNVNRHNSALDFYKKNGFSILFEEDISIGNGYFMNDYRLEKKLSHY